MRPTAPAALLGLALLAAPALAQAQELPSSALAVRQGRAWRTWWHAETAPERWAAALPTVASAARWRRAAPGVEWAELRLSGSGEAWRLRVVLVRLEPRALRLRLVRATRDEGTRGAWALESSAAEALVALNAGQFEGSRPWGWVVRRGQEEQAPGFGPLSMALVVDAAGAARLVPADRIAAVRAAGGVVEAFQSYPALLDGDGVVPPPLRAPGRGVDVGHRDARLAIGQLRDGRLLLALTRFEGLGGALAVLPFGPTGPEMAALMGALGCARAVLLDGGISGQLRLRSARGELHDWPGLRRVPLALEVLPAALARAAQGGGGR